MISAFQNNSGGVACGGVRKPSGSKEWQLTPRGSGFGQAEVSLFLVIIERTLPLRSTVWQSVLTEHEQCFPQQSRPVETLQRKFTNLHQKKMRTGDHLMPDDVCNEKKIHQMMIRRGDISVADEATASMLIPTNIPELLCDHLDIEACREVRTQTCMVTDIAVTDTDPSSWNNQSMILTSTDTQKEMLRLLVIHHNVAMRQKEEPDDFIALLKAQIIQEGIQSDEEHKQREYQRRDREEDRRESRARWAEGARRQDAIMI